MVTRLKQVFLKRPLLAWGSLAILAYLGYTGGRWVGYAPLGRGLLRKQGAEIRVGSPKAVGLA